MSKIKSVFAREILASGGLPSVETTVTLEDGSVGEASVSYGASAGTKEAFVLLDNDANRYHGKGMLNAVKNVNEKISPLLRGSEASSQREIDNLLINTDGTQNKSRLGANAILSVSMAIARAAAASQQLELYEYLQQIFNLKSLNLKFPKPLAVLIEGGVHADNSTDLQEYALAVLKDQSAHENIRLMEEVYLYLKKLLKNKGYSTNVGNEGAFAPEGIENNELPLELITQSIIESGHTIQDAGIYIDAAASEFFKASSYYLKTEHQNLSSQEIIQKYLTWFKKYPIVALEDGLSEFDWEHWPKLLAEAGKTKIVADDLTVTNTQLWQKAIEKKAANAILIKLNQAGTVTETVDCCILAKEHNLSTIPSHRGGGETNDTFLVDLAVAVGSDWIKVGPTRGERVCKYNRLMRIEEILNSK
ncbi:MAG: phosphopyruvate hydratase [Candidatus Doudnabacteria bacterium]|nr:phosphopyruvate hydratase [Candidatus Doudnabacteria bacterium]